MKTSPPPGPVELHVVAGLRHRIVRDRGEAFGLAVGPGEDAQHAGHRLGARRIDPEDTGMRVRRAHHGGIDLALEAEIVGEPAPAGHEPRILVARERLADDAEHGFVHVDGDPNCTGERWLVADKAGKQST